MTRAPLLFKWAGDRLVDEFWGDIERRIRWALIVVALAAGVVLGTLWVLKFWGVWIRRAVRTGWHRC